MLFRVPVVVYCGSEAVTYKKCGLSTEYLNVKRYISCSIQLISTNQNISYTLFVTNRHSVTLIKTSTDILNTEFYSSVTCVIILNYVILPK